jgi:signal transduction histidine kinase
MAARPLKEFKYGIYILILIVCILVYDFYNNYSINPDIWGTEWFRWRVAMVIVLAVLLTAYVWLRREQKARTSREEFTKRIIHAQEKEWKQIAAELHDGVGQYLTFVNNQILQIANSMNGEGKKEELIGVSRNLVISVDEIRRIMSKLYPHQLERLGFTKAVESLISRIQADSGLNINSEIENIDNLIPPEYQINIYRIIQESLNNIIKHANADNINISLYSDSSTIYLRIEDNGVGFAAIRGEENYSASGYGIEFMKERARIIGGKIKIDSKSGNGTIIIITIPKFNFQH